MFNIKVLNAQNGDCIIISYGEEKMHHILIDGGHGRLCFRQLCEFVEDIKCLGEKIDVLILSHIDNDHIDGIISLLSQSTFDFTMIKEIWFDFGKGIFDILGIEAKKQKISLCDKSVEISWKQGKDLEEIIQNEGIQRRCVTKLEKYCVGGAEITILSPTKEILRKLAGQDIEKESITAQIAMNNDYGKSITELVHKEYEKHITLTNKSSIACLVEVVGESILLLGDADPDVIVNSLMELGYSKTNRLKVDYCKIAHHASKHNTTNELIQMLECSNYIISTQQTAQGRPSKECLSRIICNSEKPITFYCNYKIDENKIFTKEELGKYKIRFITLEAQGITSGED